MFTACKSIDAQMLNYECVFLPPKSYETTMLTQIFSKISSSLIIAIEIYDICKGHKCLIDEHPPSQSDIEKRSASVISVTLIDY